MSDKIKKIMNLESKLALRLENGIDTQDIKTEKIVLTISNLLKKLSNKELLYLLPKVEYIHRVIDMTAYFKKYELNKEEIEKERLFLAEFKKLENFIEEIRDVSICEEEYAYICKMCDIDEVANYLLNNMTNEEIMQRANTEDDWNYKLFLFGFLKK